MKITILKYPSRLAQQVLIPAIILSILLLVSLPAANSAQKPKVDYHGVLLEPETIDYLNKNSLSQDDPKQKKIIGEVEGLVGKLRLPTDPQFLVRVVKSDSINAWVKFEQGDRLALVGINMGVIKNATTLDEISGVLAHELAHTINMGRKLNEREKSVQSQREEIITADIGGMERMIRSGFDPYQLPVMLSKIYTTGSRSEINELIAISTHPHPQARLTIDNAWLAKQHGKVSFPAPSVLSESFIKAAAQIEASDKIKTVYNSNSKFDFFNALIGSGWYQKMNGRQRIDFLTDLLTDEDFEVAVKFILEYPTENKFSEGETIALLGAKNEIKKRVPEGYKPSRFNSPEILAKFHDLFISTSVQYGIDSRVSLETVMQKKEWDSKDFHFYEVGKACFQIVQRKISFADYRDYMGHSELLKSERVFLVTEFLATSSVNGETLSFFRELLNLMSENGKYAWLALPVDRVQQITNKVPQIFDILRGHNIDLLNGIAEAIRKDGFNIAKRSDNKDPSTLAFGRAIIGQLFIALKDQSIPFSSRLGLYKELPTKFHYPSIFDEDFKKIPDVATFLRKLDQFPKDVIPRLFFMRQDWHWSLAEAQAFIQSKDPWIEAGLFNDFRDIIRDVGTSNFKFSDYDGLVRDAGNVAKKLEAPAYNYDLVHSEKVQQLLVAALARSGTLPQGLRQQHDFYSTLASRGATHFTDQALERIILDKDFGDTRLLRATLEKRLIWDFSTRKKVYLKLFAIENPAFVQPYDPHKTQDEVLPEVSDSVLKKHVLEIDGYFPEYSMERAQVYEQIANSLRTNKEQTKTIERAKYDGTQNMEGAAIRMISGLLGNIDRTYSTDDQKFDLVKYLITRRDPPENIKRQMQKVGEDRFFRQFNSMTPEIRALKLNTIIGPPKGIANDPKQKAKLVNLVLADVGGSKDVQETSKLLLDGLLDTLRQVAPFEETLALSYMLSLKSNGKVSHPGEAIRFMLEAMGGVGISIGQKIYQRQLLPPDFLTYLADLQDSASVPTRMTIFELIEGALQLPDVDNVISLDHVLGAASSKVVVKVRFKNGAIKEMDESALKLLLPHFHRRTEVEIQKLDLLYNYLVKNGGGKYRRLAGVFDSVKRGLLAQADLSLEGKVYDNVSKLYSSGELDHESGFIFKVVSNREAGSSHALDVLARGRPLKSLTPIEEAHVFPAIYHKESKILLGRGVNVVIRFEPDRHKGNYLVDLTATPPIIYVIDYPLVSEISVKERGALFDVLGLIHLAQGSDKPGKIKSIYLQRLLAQELKELFANSTMLQTLSVQKSITEALSKPSEMGGSFGTLYDLFARLEQQGLKVKPKVYDYMTALGHLEHYSKYSTDAAGHLSFQSELRVAIEGSLKSKLQQGSALDRWVLEKAENREQRTANAFSCSAMLSRLGRFVKEVAQ
jgi:hypothetical protein